MKAKEMIIDFAQWVFMLILVVIFILYFIVGNRFFAFTHFLLKMAFPIFMTGLFFLLALKTKVNEIEKLRKEDNLLEVLTYITRLDKIKDFVVICFVPFFVLLIAFYDKDVESYDYIQAFSSFMVLFFWHRMLFKRKEGITGLSCLTVFDKHKDELMIFFMPLLIMIIGLKSGSLDIVDWLQAAMVFVITYLWHKFLFKIREK